MNTTQPSNKGFGKVLLTGGSSGLGLALARQLAKEGAQLGLIALEPELPREQSEELQTLTTTKVLYRSADVSDEKITRVAIQELAEALGGIDILINCAGILREGYFEDLPLSDFQNVMNVNVYGVINATRAALPFLKRSQGRIVNIASIAGLSGVFGYGPYCTAKYAVVGLSETLRFEMKPQGVSVQIICPPEFDSPMVDKLNQYRTPENRLHTLLIPKLSVDRIVDGTLRGIESKRFLTVPGRKASIAVWVMRHFSNVSRFFADSKIKKMYIGPKNN
jgi:3-dehydrosphinganine reductase